ncbi:hypothetical protein [Actinopolymorpha cephalotaxi]|uniref:Uncharacterized protein n=1 Tax=Actinopolymorpha cephalotaxi TaxID=504797 RepID=A0ABX2S317_9ACTN|nr:hypothetical protein [Actinopolymorpha cephalotaxi]NYH84025.1 hypothetical protein [Actinopolymorpha cephalotaxi]
MALVATFFTGITPLIAAAAGGSTPDAIYSPPSIGTPWGPVKLSLIVGAFGVVCIFLAILGGGIKWKHGGIERIGSLRRQIVLGLFGIVLVVLSLLMNRWYMFHVVEVEAQWDSPEGYACAGPLNYTINLTTNGPGQVKYRITLNNREHVTLTKRVTHAGTTSFDDDHFSEQFLKGIREYDPSYPTVGLNMGVSTLDPNEVVSPVVNLPPGCDPKHQIEVFFSDLSETVKEYGRTSSAVTHDFYDYPLDYYGHQPPFETEDDFVCYIKRCGRPPLKTNPTRSNCHYQPAKVRSITSINNKVVTLEAGVDWAAGKKAGVTIVDYVLERAQSGQPFRIISVRQPRKSEKCQ